MDLVPTNLLYEELKRENMGTSQSWALIKHHKGRLKPSSEHLRTKIPNSEKIILALREKYFYIDR